MVTNSNLAAVKHSNTANTASETGECKVAVIWIDWYAYHVARFQGLMRHSCLAGSVAGVELVGGVGVHAGLKFREEIPSYLPVHTLLPAGNWTNANKWQLARSVWQHLNRLNPSVVLVPGYYTLPALAAAVWAKWKGKKSVLMTESTEHDHSRVWWRETIKKTLILSLFDWAVAGGLPHRRYLQQLGFPMNRVARFYDVVDNSFFAECCRDLRHSHQARDFDLPNDYFLYVGRIAAEKGIDLLLNGYTTYRQAGGTASLVLVGDGPRLQEVKSLAAKTPYSADIYFPGLKSTSELPKYYAFASAFVLASKREPWGLVVNEAMASGLPVIISNRCGCAEDLVVDADNGFTFDPFKDGRLADCLIRFGKLSAGERQTMASHSSKLIAQFSPDAFAAEIQKIVEAQA
jgi:1,2-diacylglycerol 3-alpha-glucosyltransferase